ncbi:MAG: DUF6318 family protein, partial [Kocuria sp.]|nr:DUF6318 family protein [Kocuria sp.]
GDGGDGPVTEPPPEINAGSDDGGASDGGGADAGSGDGTAASDAGGEDDGSTQAAPDIPPPDPADFPGMDENTPEGAEQAVRFYFANVYWGYQTGDSSRASELYSEGCEACAKFETQIDGFEGGSTWGRVEIADFGITHYESENFDYEIGYIFTVGKHEAPGDSEEVLHVEATDYTAIAGVTWGDGCWVIGGMSFGEAGSE